MPCSQLFYVTNVSFNAIRGNKILAKISEFTVYSSALQTSLYHGRKHCELRDQSFSDLGPYRLQ